MTTTQTDRRRPASSGWLNKVPEVTLFFWIIKILCTTVGESFADWINGSLGVGLVNTSLLFTGVLALVLAVQLRLPRYVPAVYWLTVVVVSVTGTLYTDILTDERGVPLRVSTSVFAALLAVVFGIWYARERTLSIHSITTLPRELFYWLAVLVTFALGTAAGDWTLELTGWGPGTSILLPAGLIAVVVLCWRLGAQPVLSFWLAYILTRPLGANIGDFLALPSDEKGLGLGTALTSVVFLRRDRRHRGVPDDQQGRRDRDAPAGTSPTRPRGPGGSAPCSRSWRPSPWPPGCCCTTPRSSRTPPRWPTRAPAPWTRRRWSRAGRRGSRRPTWPRCAARPGLLAAVQAGDQAAAKARAKDLETAWDDDQGRLEPVDEQAWTSLDGEIDTVLSAARASSPDPAAESQADAGAAHEPGLIGGATYASGRADAGGGGRGPPGGGAA